MSEAPSIDGHFAGLSATPPPAPGDATLARAVRGYLAAVHAHLEALHRGGASGSAVNEAHSDLMDRLLRRLFGQAQRETYAAGVEITDPLAVLAVGGYARREMSIHSDVDLLFLHEGKVTPVVRAVTERMQYALWDGGLQVGCATRTPRETLKLARADTTVATAVLDVRFLEGDAPLFHRFAESVRTELVSDARSFIAQALLSLYERHRKFGESLYLLQPNVKEGAGALRDYHAAYWVARAVHPAIRGLDTLLHYGLLTEAEMVEYRRGLEFLWRVRNELHLLCGRKNDQMSFEHQERLADALGYGPDDGRELPVERFMGEYYRHARAIQTHSEIVIEQSSAQLRGAAKRPKGRGVAGGFRVVADQLEIPHAALLRESPLRLCQAYRAAEREDVTMSRTAQRLVRENLDLVDDAFRADPGAAECFMGVLGSENRVMRTLMSMNESGLLGRYLPEWDHIVCRWQHVAYHTYTVDVHSIFLVEQLRRLWKGEYEKSSPELTHLIRAEDDKPTLYLACLLHDVGKGRGGNHSIKGADLARTCCTRIGLPSEQVERVVFLVEHHLLMSHLAQRRDLSDPKVLIEFARTCGDRRNLRNLYLLTFADIRASSTSAWTEWKGRLLHELFERTSEFLEVGGDDPARAARLIDARVDRRERAAARSLERAGVDPADIQAYFRSMPRRYFLSHTAKEISRHVPVVLALDRERPLSMAVSLLPDGSSELIVCASDVHGLYSKVAGTITARGLNILGSHVYTTRSGLALEVYRLDPPPGGEVERTQAWRALETMLSGVLSGSHQLDELLRQRPRLLGPSRVPSHRPPSVHITNAESDFYTIVDVATDDRPGLLYDLTRTITEQGYEIYVSKAATVLDQVADTFYLKDAEGNKLTDPQRLETLHRALFTVVAADAPEGAR